MDARQDRLANPLGFDRACPNCPELCEARDRIVHGYGEVDADFLVVGESPSSSAEAVGVPFGGPESVVLEILRELGVIAPSGDPTAPALEKWYLTYLARCRHPDRGVTEEEIRNCDPFLTAEIRMINPEIIIPIGDRVLRTLAAEYTTHDPATLTVAEQHATELRGRGFEFIPLREPADLTESGREAFIGKLARTIERDYQQPKGRRGRAEREQEHR